MMFREQLDSLREKGLLRVLRTVEPIQGGTKAFVDDMEYTMFCSNDYLGLSCHPNVVAAARRAVDEMGFGAGSAPLIAGHTPHHQRLEGEMAALKDAEAALLFGSGYLANVGLVPALAGEGDVIFSDSLNHASIIDGCRLSRADVKVYAHHDTTSLETLLKENTGYRRRIIITEGLFGMDGDIAPLPEISILADWYDALIVLDDAHATGTLGALGRGTLEHFAHHFKPDMKRFVHMGTLGKALGSYGAFAAASRDTVDWLVNSSRSFIFSTALPPAACAAASAAAQVISDEPERLMFLRRNTEILRLSLKEKGFEVLGDNTPIIPIVFGGPDETLKAAARLLDKGIYAPAIRPPSVPEGECRIRLTVSAMHTDADIERLVDALGDA